MKFFSSDEGSPRRDLGILFAFFGVLFFQFLGRMPLIDPDEGRYIEIPREMLERGDFITPTLNYVKYFEKPPLQYWLNALSLTIFGENEFAARFAGTLCGLLTILLTYYLGRRLFGRRPALFAAILLGSAGGFLVQARINFTDMTLTFFLSAAFAFFLLAVKDGATHRKRDYFIFYACMALAILAKGLIGIVLPGAVIFLYMAATGRWRLLKEMRLLSGSALFLAILAPWFVLVSLRNPGFLHFFFIHEHFQRYLSKVHHRYQPFWFFLPVLAGTMLPWSLFIPAALKKGWQERKIHRETLFLLLWAGVIFVFFSASGSKLIPYILPVFPPLALLTGKWFAETRDLRLVGALGTATGAILGAIGLAVIIFPHLSAKGEISAIDGAVVGGVLILQGSLAIVAGRKGEPTRLFALLAATACFFAAAAPPVIYAQVAKYKSAKELARAINQRGGKDARVACFGEYQQGIPFYTHKRVILVGDPDELEFGRDQGDHRAWFLEKSAFIALWKSPGVLFTILKLRDLPMLQKLAAAPVEVVTTAGDRVLVVNHPLGPIP
jgi:4-amino-4-deoxy-L-arabinose transferase-like glycosyltransferase